MKLYYNPLSGYSMKVILALAEKDISFEKEVVNLFDASEKEKYKKLYPIGKIPLLELEDAYKIPESSIIIEWIDQNYNTGLIPTDKDKGRKARFYDRMNDLYIQNPVGTIFFDGLKPEDMRNPEAVKQAKEYLNVSFRQMDQHLSSKEWLVDNYSIADISAFPGLFWAQKVYPYDNFKNITSYFNRLMERKPTQKLMAEVGPALDEWQKNSL